MEKLNFANVSNDVITEQLNNFMSNHYSNSIWLDFNFPYFLEGIKEGKIEIIKIKHLNYNLPKNEKGKYRELIGHRVENENTELAYYYAYNIIKAFGDEIKYIPGERSFRIAKKLRYFIRCGNLSPDRIIKLYTEYEDVNGIWLFPNDEYIEGDDDIYYSYFFKVNKEYIYTYETEKNEKLKDIVNRSSIG